MRRQALPANDNKAIARALCRSTETLLTSKAGFGLTTASPLQRGVCRLIDGAPLGELTPVVERALACSADQLQGKPREVAIISGIRVAKSIIAACVAVKASQTVDCSICGPGDNPRVSIVSHTKDLAGVVFGHLKGRVLESPYLRSLLVTEPTSDTVTLEHPSGRHIEIKVVAGSRAGTSLTARWMAGVVFDEFARMLGGDEAVVNWDDSRAAVKERILPGGCIVHITSPHGPFGPAYKLITESLGKPSADLVTIKAPAYDMNPYYWTPERIEQSKADPEVFRTDVLAEFKTPEESLFSLIALERSTREQGDVPPEWGAEYCAAMDPAMRGNGWTLVIASRKANVRRVVLTRQWVGSKTEPLSANEVLEAIARIVKGYGLTTVLSDQYNADALRDIAVALGLTVVPTYWTEKQKTERYVAFATRLNNGAIEMHPDPVLRADLVRVKKRVTQGGVSVVLPRTSDGRHCDYVPALILAMHQYLDDVKPANDNDEYKEEVERIRRRAVEAAVGTKRKRWQ